MPSFITPTIGLDTESSYEFQLAHRGSEPAVLSAVFECDDDAEDGVPRSLLNAAVEQLVRPRCQQGRLFITAEPEGLLPHHHQR